MKKFLMSKKNLVIVLLLVVLALPSFVRMLRPGVFSMHDFHIFRLFEFDRCIRDLQIPCRWAPDASLGYGQPLFNFYGQIVYIPGEILHLLGFQIIDSIKFLFILSLGLSAITMFLLARQLWGSRLSGLLAAVLYVYAPYRAVDVWVRGALPEAFSFVFFPLIILFLNRYILQKQTRDLLFFNLFLVLLLLSHNLSFFMFLVFLVPWAVFNLTVHKKWFLVKRFFLAGVLTFGLSGFYILPVLFEKSLVTLSDTTVGYYNFRAHFTTLHQLLISRIWGYGASQWGPVDNLSLSIGHVQWIISFLIFVAVLVTRRFRQRFVPLFLIVIGWFALFLTHGRSAFIWEAVPPLAFIQFPWRFLSIAVFILSLAGGALAVVLKPKVRAFLIVLLIFVVIVWNFQFFKEDIWFNTTDREQFIGETWVWHTSSARNDFWPKYAQQIPEESVSAHPLFLQGTGEIFDFNKTSNSMSATTRVDSQSATIQFPGVYFDGWRGFADGMIVEIYPAGNYGQIAMKVDSGKHNLDLRFTNTPVRTLGNILSLFSLGVFVWLMWKRK